jgi:uncharacterized lipoprotein NlpE involved in copper resistance
MKKKLVALSLILFLLTSCGEHSGQEISKFTGEYRYYAGIAEFFDCKSGVKYYIAKVGVGSELQEAYLKLDVKEKDDVYLQIKGYLKEEQQMEGIDPATVFVPVKLLSFDKNRGCKRGFMQGR